MRYMHQSVRLTGLGSSHFQDGVDGMANIVNFIGNKLDDDDVEGWTPSHFQEWKAIDFVNCLFVRQNIEGDIASVPFANGVDPEGVLARVSGSEWVHTKENTVQYFTRVVKDGKLLRCVIDIQCSYLLILLHKA